MMVPESCAGSRRLDRVGRSPYKARSFKGFRSGDVSWQQGGAPPGISAARKTPASTDRTAAIPSAPARGQTREVPVAVRCNTDSEVVMRMSRFVLLAIVLAAVTVPALAASGKVTV